MRKILYSVSMKFSELHLTEQTNSGIQAAGFDSCMPVQEKVFSHSLSGKDVMVQSQTGTGKTAAFLITILERFSKKEETAASKALVIVPTRELAVQIAQEAELLSSGLPKLTIGTFYGGVGYAQQDKVLGEDVDLFIGTPGRLLDYQKAGKIDFKAMDLVVVDEADRMFDMGFYPDILEMFKKMRSRDKRQTMLFSATLTNRARNLAWDFMNEPVEIEIEPELMTVEAINQQLFHVSKAEKFSVLLRILAKLSPTNALIFTNTKSMAVELSKRLEINGYDAHMLMGDLPQKKRLQVIDKMKEGKIKFLVATDVAARGLHVDDLELVVNYDIPEDFENYVHRIGRTARAGKSGHAITLACEQFVYGLESIEEYIQMKIPVVWLDEQEYPKVEDKSAHLRFGDLIRSYRNGTATSSKPGRSRSSDRRSPSGTRGGSGGRSSSGSRSSSSSRSGSTQRSSDSRKSSSGAPQERRPRPAGNTPKPAGSAPRPERSPRPERGPRPERRPKNSRGAKDSVDPAVGQMSFDERIEYYKSKYGSELAADVQQGSENKSPSGQGKPGSSNRRRRSGSQGQRSGQGKGGAPRQDRSPASRDPQPKGGTGSTRASQEARKPQKGPAKPSEKPHQSPAAKKQEPAVETKTPKSTSKKGFFSRIVEKIASK